MPASSRSVRSRLRAQRRQRINDLSRAVHELQSCTTAVLSAASAIAAGLHANMIDGDDAYQLLLCVFERQHRAMIQLDAAVEAVGGAA